MLRHSVCLLIAIGAAAAFVAPDASARALDAASQRPLEFASTRWASTRARASSAVCAAPGDLDVVVVGSANTDLCCKVSRQPRIGETLEGDGFATFFGGKGANQAVIAGRLGANVAMVCKVGVDAFGEEQVANFEANGVVMDSVLRAAPGTPTGVAAITVDGRDGANTIIVVPGANGELSPADIAAPAAAGLIERAKVVVAQNEVPVPTSEAALRAARAAGATAVFNPAPAGDAKAIAALAPLLPLADIVAPNEVELAQLLSFFESGGDPDATVPVLETVEQICDAATALLARIDSGGKTTLVVTAGAKGAVVARGAAAGGGAPELVPTVALSKEEVKDTVGAGDAFVGSLCSYLARGVELDDAVKRACAVASISVQTEGAQASYPAVGSLPSELAL